MSAAMGRRLLGLAFVVALLAAASLAVLAYRKAFTPADWVTLRTDHVGMQLNDGAEVKLRGVVVGEVRQISANGAFATLRLAMDPSTMDRIPDNVSARLLPKTLFGERYVALVEPAAPSPRHLRDGAVILQDRTTSAVELERVLDRALPLLQAIHPDKLAATLGALSYALDGRGERLGGDLTTLDAYLTALNRQMPAISADIRRLAGVLDTYHGALPDLMSILRDATVSARTVVDQRAELSRFLAGTTDLADTTRGFLGRYGDRIIQLGRLSRPVLELLAAYAPEYPCVLRGLVDLQPAMEGVYASGAMHVTLEVTRDNGKYVRGRDEPVYGAAGGPSCRGLPDPAVPGPEIRINDGYGGGGAASRADVVGADAEMGYAGTVEERALVKPLVAATTGTTPDAVPDVAVLLWGPLLRGSVVNEAPA